MAPLPEVCVAALDAVQAGQAAELLARRAHQGLASAVWQQSLIAGYGRGPVWRLRSHPS